MRAAKRGKIAKDAIILYPYAGKTRITANYSFVQKGGQAMAGRFPTAWMDDFYSRVDIGYTMVIKIGTESGRR